jgi:hypothetical protein
MKNKLKGLAKIIAISAIGLAALQFCTFHLFAKWAIIKPIGENFETYLLELNQFEKTIVIADYDYAPEDLTKHFIHLKNLPNDFYTTDSYVHKTIDSVTHCYSFTFNKFNAFGFSEVYEAELAKEFGADWKSKYIWVIYKWILIEKVDIGVS